MTRSEPKDWRNTALVVALVGSTLVAFAGAGLATTSEVDPPGVVFISAWTNDDGTVDEADVGDIGDVSVLFDRWGTASSDDPAAPFIDPDRYDKDVAICTARVTPGTPPMVQVTADNAYPGYVCTTRVTLLNQLLFPLDVGTISLEAPPELTVTATSDPSLPGVVAPGGTVTVTITAHVEQSAPQNGVLLFSASLTLSGADCIPLTEDDIPPGAVLVNASGLCTYFYDAPDDPDCGPGWTPEFPYAWHFLAIWTEGLPPGQLTAVFIAAGEVGPVETTKINRRMQHFWVYTATPDTVRGTYVDIPAAKVVLSHTCSAPGGS